jgi:hypothetical protein
MPRKRASKAVSVRQASEPPPTPATPATPSTPDELHRWCRQTLGLSFPRTAVIEGHSAPFEYLCHVFFGCVTPNPWDAPAPVLDPTRVPLDSVLWANRGGSKTLLGAVATARDMIFRPGIQVRILAGSLDQGSRMYAYLRELFERPGLRASVRGKITGRRLSLYNNSAVEILAHAHAAVRGQRVQRLRCDEVDLFDPEVYNAAQLITRSAQCGDYYVHGTVECLSTMHVPGGVMQRMVADAADGKRRLFHWGLVDVLERCGDAHKCQKVSRCQDEEVPRCQGAQVSREEADTARVTLTISAPSSSDSVPLTPGHLDPLAPVSEEACPLWAQCRGKLKDRAPEEAGHITIDDALAMRARVSDEVWETEMDTKIPHRGHLVVPEFKVTAHVFESGPPMDAKLWAAGMDFGIRSPTTLVWAAVDPSGTVWVMDEHSATDESLDVHIALIHSGLAKPRRGKDRRLPPWPLPDWIGIDPAGLSRSDQTGISNAAVLRKAQLVVKARRTELLRGIEVIREWLRSTPTRGPRLYVHKRCRGLIEALGAYHYSKENPASCVPVKDGPDHMVDALRYLVVNATGESGTKWGNYA